MPAKSPAQARLMQAAKAGATFPKAKAIRQSMSRSQLDDFTNVDPSRFESEATRYNWRSRQNLKRGKD